MYIIVTQNPWSTQVYMYIVVINPHAPNSAETPTWGQITHDVGSKKTKTIAIYNIA